MRQVIVAILALHLVACSSASNGPGDGGPGASGGSRGTGGSGGTGATAGSGGASAIGGSGGAVGTCGLGDQDCICPGGYFTCQNDRTTCVCPPTCTRSDQCGSDAICVFQDGNCGGGASGYCLSPARAATWICAPRPTCGCDGKLYDDACAAVAARVSPSAAATSACASQPQPCTSGSTSGPSTTSCFPTEYCMISNGSGSTSASCSRFDISCAQPSCDCLSYNAASCHCDLLSTGLVRLTCNF